MKSRIDGRWQWIQKGVWRVKKTAEKISMDSKDKLFKNQENRIWNLKNPISYKAKTSRSQMNKFTSRGKYKIKTNTIKGKMFEQISIRNMKQQSKGQKKNQQIEQYESNTNIKINFLKAILTPFKIISWSQNLFNISCEKSKKIF